MRHSSRDADFPLLISIELLDHRIRPMYESPTIHSILAQAHRRIGRDTTKCPQYDASRCSSAPNSLGRYSRDKPGRRDREPNPGCLRRNAPNTAGAGNRSCTARRLPLFPARRSKPATLDPPTRFRAAGPGAASRSGGRRSVRRGPRNGLAAAFLVCLAARTRRKSSREALFACNPHYA